MVLFERVQTEARSVDPVRALLTVLAVPLFAVGWTLGVAFRGVVFVAGWMWAAGVVGWRSARGGFR